MSMIRNSVRAFVAAATTAQTSRAPVRSDGALQVRTSALAILTAAVVPAAVYAIAAIPLVATLFDTWPVAGWSMQIVKLAISSALFVITLLTALLPSAVVVGVTHALARSLQRRRDVDYAAIGAVVSLVAAPMMDSYLPATIPLATLLLAGALAAAAYRRLSGMEREPLFGAALVKDRGRPVGKRHPRRGRPAVGING